MKKEFTKVFYTFCAVMIFAVLTLTTQAQTLTEIGATGGSNQHATAMTTDKFGNVWVIVNPTVAANAKLVEYVGGAGSPVAITSSIEDDDPNNNNGAYGLASDSQGNIYASTGNGATNGLILKFTYPTYAQSTLVTGSSSIGFFNTITVGPDDMLYAVQYNANGNTENAGVGDVEVARYPTTTTTVNTATVGGTPLYTDLEDNFFLGIKNNPGNYDAVTTIGGLAVDASLNIYVADGFDDNQLPTSSNGQHIYKLLKPGSGNNYTLGSTVESNFHAISLAMNTARTNLYATEALTYNNIYSVVEYAGGTGSPITLYTESTNPGFYPYGLAYVSDSELFFNDGGINSSTVGDIDEIYGVPTTQASGITFSSTALTSTTINWTNGNGASRAVFMAAASSGTPAPATGTAYTANTVFGTPASEIGSSGWYCVYNGNGLTVPATVPVTVTGLSVGTTYRVMAVDYNGSSTFTDYITSTGTNNPNNVTTLSPTISTSGTPSALTTVSGTPSSSTNFTVNGSNLSANITATASSGFDISLNNSTWSGSGGSQTITQSGGSVSGQTVYVRLDGSDGSGTYASGNVALTSTGAITVNVGIPSSSVTSPSTTISSLTAVSSTSTNTTTIQYTATFAASVSGLSTADFSLNTSGVSGASVTSVSGSGTAYTITVNTGTGDGTIQLLMNSASGVSPSVSNLPFNGGTYTIDKTAPTLTSLIYQSNNARFNYAKVGDVVSLTFGADEALQTQTVTIGGHSITATNTGGNNYSASYTMTSGDTEGRIPFSLTITDLAGNQGFYNDVAAGDDIEFDMTQPSVAIGKPSLSQIGAGSGSVSYTVTYSDANFNAATLSPSDITLNSTGTASGSVGVSNSGTTSTVTISGITGVGRLGFSIGANTASDLAGNEAPSAGPSATFSVVSTDASLSNLQVDAGNLIPGFINGTTSYRLVLGSGTDAVTVTPTSNDANATIAVNGTPVTSGAGDVIKLTPVINNVSIVVTAQDGVTTQTYSLTIARVSPDNTHLISIRPSTGGLSPGMSPAITSYTSSVGNLVTSMTVTPIAADPQATITVNGVSQPEGTTSAPISLNVGANAIAIEVTSANGIHHKTYTLTVTRAPSSNALLSSLAPSQGVRTSGFSPLTNNPALTVGNVSSSITITPTTRDANATVTVNGVPVTSGTASAAIPLNVGDNTITTVVTAQDLTTTNTYTMVVTRAPSSDADLIAIRPSNGGLSPAFSSDVINYTSAVSNTTTSMTIAPEVQDATASLAINNAQLASGSTSEPIMLNVGDNPIAIVVTAQDGTQKTYTLTVTRAVASMNTVYEPVSVSNPTSHPQMMGEELAVHQSLSPNGDGINDFLIIDGINNYPDNKLQIMNRSGALVFEAKGYDNSTKVFDGHSNKNGTMQLPGTYFYSLDFKANGVTQHKTGFIVLKY